MSRGGSPDDADAGSVQLTREGDLYIAKDDATGVASQGETRAEALANLAEAIELHESPIPDDVDASEPDAPWFSD